MTHNGPKLPSCNRQEAKGCNYRVRVLFLPERNGTLTVRICRIISNPGYYTSKNHLERSRPELELHQASACLDPHGSSCPSHQMLHSSFCQSMRTLFFTAEKDVPWWVATLLAKHTSQKRTTSVMSVVCFVNKVEQAFAHELPTTIPWWRLQKRSRKLIIHSSMLIIYLV